MRYSHLIYNINFGHNKELMEQCRALSDYAYFISRVRHYNREKGYAIDKAVDTACMECIEKDILREFLLKNRSEVMSMFMVDYKPSLQRELDRKEGYEDGFSKGEAAGFQDGRATDICDLLGELAPVPEELKQRIFSEKNPDVLKKWLFLAAKAESIDQFIYAMNDI